jgi:3-deoxy-7-phosphoheptulonate synthase
VRIAVDALLAARERHHFLSVHKSGHVAIVETRGNPDCHIILRGGKEPNHDAASVRAAREELARAKLPERLMIDCSHANAAKKPERQTVVARDVAARVAAGEHAILGVMIESNLVEGRQDLVPGEPLRYGQSVTDACLGWDDSVTLLDDLATAVRHRRQT